MANFRSSTIVEDLVDTSLSGTVPAYCAVTHCAPAGAGAGVIPARHFSTLRAVKDVYSSANMVCAVDGNRPDCIHCGQRGSSGRSIWQTALCNWQVWKEKKDWSASTKNSSIPTRTVDSPSTPSTRRTRVECLPSQGRKSACAIRPWQHQRGSRCHLDAQEALTRPRSTGEDVPRQLERAQHRQRPQGARGNEEMNKPPQRVKAAE